MLELDKSSLLLGDTQKEVHSDAAVAYDIVETLEGMNQEQIYPDLVSNW